LGDYDGIVVADRYVVYLSLEKARTKNGGARLLLPFDGVYRAVPTPDYTLAVCWMHARRGFIRAAKAGMLQAEPILDLIGELYAVEAEAARSVAQISDRDARHSALVEARGALREVRSRALIQQLDQAIDGLTVIDGTHLAAAVTWIRNGWTELVRFLDDARIPLDNGVAERIIRGVVLGRNVYHGSRSEAGTRVAALFYSLLESCRLEGVDGQAYLAEAARRALKNREDVFLPEDFARMTQQSA
jgi:transposase